MADVMPFDRRRAVDYAHRWAHHRNPDFYDFSQLGGDCTNFASQCLYAGAGTMNYAPTFGWYYHSPSSRAPAWTGVQYLYNFLTRSRADPGPYGEEAPIQKVRPGDLVQLCLSGGTFVHAPVVVSVGDVPAYSNILVAAHSQDTDYRPLDTYPFQAVRFIHILGVRR